MAKALVPRRRRKGVRGAGACSTAAAARSSASRGWTTCATPASRSTSTIPSRISNLGILNNRDHRKIFVIDGRIGYIGGHCLVDNWLGDAAGQEALPRHLRARRGAGRGAVAVGVRRELDRGDRRGAGPGRAYLSQAGAGRRHEGARGLDLAGRQPVDAQGPALHGHPRGEEEHHHPEPILSARSRRARRAPRRR